MIGQTFGRAPFLRLHGDLDEMREALGECGPHDALGHRGKSAEDRTRAEKPRALETARTT
ncbi:hypothetical protein [Thetidibacter halocola]|uniref:Uncharacterized protein n=1 Tax=Thetidibacter halocola TaxID=2827239 RepID=A0A8J8B7B8_9RHOB|nr:hypothetical protein [Thetidibacter halocola]MBS0124262.1 hypothetical protein [Thetidibacter halocola]